MVGGFGLTPRFVSIDTSRSQDDGEAVESFLRQDYPGPRELLVLNDCPGQELACDAPGVRVVNAPERFGSLGEKYNAAAALATGEFLLPWEDDDVSLTHRISQAVAMLGEDDYWKPPQVWFLQAGQPPLWNHPVGVRHHASVFRRSAWQAVGGYPALSGVQDARFDATLAGRCRHRIPPPHPEPWRVLPVSHWAYLYRAGG